VRVLAEVVGDAVERALAVREEREHDQRHVVEQRDNERLVEMQQSDRDAGDEEVDEQDHETEPVIGDP